MGKLGPEEKDIAGVYEARSFDFESFSLILRSRLSYLNVDILCLYLKLKSFTFKPQLFTLRMMI